MSPAQYHTASEKVVVLSEVSLCPLVPHRNTETEFWVKEKKFVLLLCQAKEGHSRLMPQRLCPPLGEIREWVYSLGGENRATDKDQGRGKFSFFRAGAEWPQDWFWGSSSLVFFSEGF